MTDGVWQLRVVTAERELWRVAAVARGLSLSEWLRRAANDQAALEDSEREGAGEEGLADSIRSQARVVIVPPIVVEDVETSAMGAGPVSRVFDRLGK